MPRITAARAASGPLPGLEGLAVPSRAALERLVVLVGPTRGGTSFVERALGVHASALVPPDLLHFTDQAWPYRRRVHDRLWRQIVMMPKAMDRRAVMAALPEDGRRQLARYMERVLRGKRFAPLYQLYAVLYALDPRNAKDAAALQCWHDKVNDWRGLGTIRRHMPKARFIVLARDPLDVVASHVRREALLDEGAPAEAAVIRAALYWRHLMQRCLMFAARHPRRTIVVRYEDVVRDPAGSLNRLFAFVGLEAMTEEAIAQGLASVRGGATNDPGERYVGASARPIGRWHRDLAPEAAALIAQLTGPTARKLGYAVEAPRAAPVTAIGLAARQAWVDLIEPLVRRPDLPPLREP